MSEDSLLAFQTLSQMNDGSPRHLSLTTDGTDSAIISHLISGESYAQEVKCNSVSCQQPEMPRYQKKTWGGYGRGKHDCNPNGTLPYYTQTHRSQCQEEMFSLSLHEMRFSINTSDLLINLYVRQWISVSAECEIHFYSGGLFLAQPVMDFRNS